MNETEQEVVKEPEFIRHEIGGWICVCTNTQDKYGFSPCDTEGNVRQVTNESERSGLFLCMECGRIIDSENLRVRGRRRDKMVLHFQAKVDRGNLERSEVMKERRQL